MSQLTPLIDDLTHRARVAARRLARTEQAPKDVGLRAMADELLFGADAILAANREDVYGGEKIGIGAAMLDRLALTPARLEAMAAGIRKVADLPDPVGRVLREWEQPNGLKFAKLSVPIGVVGFIYESRPNVTSDAAALCVKSGNAVILRGGSESLRSNLAIGAALARGLAKAGLPGDAVQIVPSTDRDAVTQLAAAEGKVDLLIPRGGRALIEAVAKNARVPVIKHYDGICAIYVDEKADLAMAEKIILNAKCSRPGVCNAAETLLVHAAVAEKFFASVGPALLQAGVQLRAEEKSLALLTKLNSPLVTRAREADFRTEFLELILAVKVVATIGEAIAHISENGSHHSDAIVTADAAAAERFLNEVDSATVYWNASTRFTDGNEFGFGAEVGISTDKLHARGPMGLEELTSYKYVIRGAGQIR